jgi:glycosyltransferase involved in cell wall biosynthesis
VIAADTTALPEVVGDAGILLPPDEPDAWAKAIEQLIVDGDERDRLIEAGHVRAARFTAAAAGSSLLAAYVSAAEL